MLLSAKVGQEIRQKPQKFGSPTKTTMRAHGINNYRVGTCATLILET